MANGEDSRGRDRGPFDPDRRRRGEPRLEDDAGPERDSVSLDLVYELIAGTEEDDPRRAVIYQLRRQLIDDEQRYQETRQEINELEGACEKLTAPANRIGIYLGSPKDRIAQVVVSGSTYFSNVDPRIEMDTLRVGSQVLLNEAYVVVGDLGHTDTGTVAKVVDELDDGRIRVGQEPTGQSTVLQRGSEIGEKKVSSGDEVLVDASARVALEVFPKQEARDYFLDEVPDVSWEQVGGQDEAINAIQDAIEMPLLHPELFERFQFTTPKGFLLYGPPGCGKTLIGKATAHNLVNKIRERTGEDIEGQFLHIKGPEILNMWLGESERKVREIFSIAREKRKQGILPFVFIDEAESVLGTRRALRSHNISNTVVPMFCAEMDGIESIEDVVIILATNRQDLIDPAILRPGRIDRKIKVNRPDENGTREIFRIYLTADLPLDRELLARHDDDAAAAAADLVDTVVDELYAERDDTRFLEVAMADGHREVLHRSDLVSGAIVASIVQRSKEYAIKRSVDAGEEMGISFDDLRDAIEQEYTENEIFPPTDNIGDWLKLIDHDPESVVSVSPIRASKQRVRAQALRGVI
ncbi:AAA family ATPase [Candidatus Poribacteria bacterium]|jgi:proteasome-associated ATPase|nr:AAA family ATPase [Candidatus Poribacteria bacterium]MBT7809317.1 AAA family ATPase [Candidatus Poribacteria bacterium]